MGRRWKNVARAAFGLAVGLALTEGAFYARDGGAYPHLNVYVADPVLGARLRPGATTRIAFGGNPATDVRINADGLRGADLPPPSPGEVLVVGDSQVFGLGVQEGQTASAQLSELLGAVVVNAGVPTYGPPEYEAVVRELLARRHSSTVVYVVNMVNDLFEAARPNVQRHVIWDGWAVRAETAPDSLTRFPGRELLFGRSHAVLALRGWWHGGLGGGTGFASEGAWKDLVATTDTVRDERARVERQNEETARKHQEDVDRAAKEMVDAQLRLEELAYKAGFGENDTPEGLEYRKTHGDPRDIVVTQTYYAEESRAPPVTARYLATGAQIRARIETAMRQNAEMMLKNPGFAAQYGGIEPFKEILRLLDDRSARKRRLIELQSAPVEVARAVSPMLHVLRDVQAVCEAAGAKLVVVALPMDVQVSADEWKKYGAEPIDMEPTRLLVRDVIEAAEAVGAKALDATPALAAAEPGAFLDKDIHMTAKGHRALAEALVPVVRDAVAGR